MPLARSGQPQRARLLDGEAEAPVIGGVADQNDRAMSAPPGYRHGALHQCSADAAATLRLINGEWTEQQSRPSRTGADVPKPHRADELFVLLGDERKSRSGAAAFAQPLGGLFKARRAPDAVEQILARGDIAMLFIADRHHGQFPSCP